MEVISSFVGPVVTITLAAIAFYATINKFMGEVTTQITDMRESIDSIKEELNELKQTTGELNINSARVEEKFNSLSVNVCKINDIIERIARIESAQEAYWLRYDDLKSRVDKIENFTKIGGTI